MKVKKYLSGLNWSAWWGWLVVVSVLIYGVVLKSLLFNLGTHLIDWNDYPLYVWITDQNIQHLWHLDWQNFFEGNIFYSFPHVLLFSDLLLPQGILGSLIYPWTHNLVLTFNLIFWLTIGLNVVGSWYFWKTFFTDHKVIWLTSILTVFSPYIFKSLNHFQMFSLWPFLFAGGWLFQTKKLHRWTAGVGGGILLAILFYSSVYLWLMLITLIGSWWLSLIIEDRRWIKIGSGYFLSFGVTFSLLAGPTIFQYWQVRQFYHAIRDYGEYVQYSAHLSDYIFPVHLQSLIYQLPPFQHWNHLNHHFGLFPGLVLSGLFWGGVVKLKQNSRHFSFSISRRRRDLFFLLSTIMGFVFSLGPRLNVNGVYTGLPLPYHFILKLPLYEAFRVPERWSLLVFLGMIYFAGKFLSDQKSSAKFILLIGCFSIAEIMPSNIPTEAKNYYPNVDNYLQEICQTKPKVLLEYPLTQDLSTANIITNLTYRTQMMLASTKHRCWLINGYSGWIPTDYSLYEANLGNLVNQNQPWEFNYQLKSKGIQIIKLNKRELYTDKAERITNWLNNPDQYQLVYNDDQYLIVKLHD